MAGGPGAIVNPVEGAEDDADAGAAAIDAAGIGPLDTVIGIASSGTHAVCDRCRPAARASSERSASASRATSGPLSARRRNTGSRSRSAPRCSPVRPSLKSGTAQKLVLNMFSTISMVRNGKAYGNLMVDVKATNHKLRERAIRMVQTIGVASRDAAVAALEAAAYDVKLASIMIRRGEDLAAATARLGAADGRLRTALEEN